MPERRASLIAKYVGLVEKERDELAHNRPGKDGVLEAIATAKRVINRELEKTNAFYIEHTQREAE